MPLKFKIDVLKALKEAGYNTNKLRNETELSESAIQRLRKQEGISWKSIELICELLDYQPGDILEFSDE